LLFLLSDFTIPDDESIDQVPIKEEERVPDKGQEGLDSVWNQRMKERLEKMKSKKMRDMSITVTQKVGISGTLASRQRKMNSSNESTTVGQGRVREELEQQQGKIKFLTGDEDGTVEICVQSILASIKNPTRFSMKVTWAAADKEDLDRSTQQSGGKSLDSSQLTSQMSRLERDIQTLQNRVKACLNNADFNKDQEAAFHQQSISMNKAARYWPMIHLIVILLTGFTQANHIVHYFKTHHIGV
jgi:hypothetical protein